MKPKPESYLTMSQAAKHMGVDASTVWRWRKSGRLQCDRKPHSVWLTKASWLEQMKPAKPLGRPRKVAKC